MVITYLGDNYFRVQSGLLTILIDPVNTRSFKGANMILNTLKPALTDRGEAAAAGVFWAENQGEYEVQSIRAEGWSTGFYDGKEHTAYLFTLEQISVACLGYLKETPGAELVEKMQGADILIIPAGGAPCLPPVTAAKAVRQIEPGVIIPSLFNSPPKQFFGELGHQPEPDERVTLKKKDISPGAMQIRWLRN